MNSQGSPLDDSGLCVLARALESEAMIGDRWLACGHEGGKIETWWYKKKRTPMKKRVNNNARVNYSASWKLVLVFKKKKRTTRPRKINCNLLKFFTIASPAYNSAVDNSKRSEVRSKEYSDLVDCFRKSKTFDCNVSEMERYVFPNFTSLVNSENPQEKVKDCDLVHNMTGKNQGAESTKEIAPGDGSHCKPDHSDIFHQDANSLPCHEQEEPTPKNQKNFVVPLVDQQRKESKHDESRSEVFSQYALEDSEAASYPTDVRSLLATGLLEGFRVIYKKKKVQIDGYIKGSGYLCGCSSCNYNRVLTALEFEKHSGMSSHNQNNSIYLNCGTKISLYKLVKELKNASIKPLAKLVEEIIQFPPNLECYEKRKASFEMNQNEGGIEANVENIQPYQEENHLSRHSPESSTQPFEGIQRSFLDSSVGSSACSPCPRSLQPVIEDHLAINANTNLRPQQLAVGSSTCLIQGVPMMLMEGSEPLASSIVDTIMEDADEKNDAMDCSESNADADPVIDGELKHLASGTKDNMNPALVVPMDLSSSGLSSEGSANLESKSSEKLADSDTEGLVHTLPASEGIPHIPLGQTAELSSLQPAKDTDTDRRTPSTCSNLTSEFPDLEDVPSEILANVTMAREPKKLLAFDTGSELSKGYSDKLPKKLFSPDLCHSMRFNNNNLKPMVFPKDAPKKRDNDLHRLVFKENGLPDGSKLSYCNKGEKLKTGHKKGNYIVCDCCNVEMSPSQFEGHAGWSQRRQPYRNIYTSTGVTLHAYSVCLSNANYISPSSSRAFCTLCGNGGPLVHCCGCSKFFHRACLEGQYIDHGKWFCSHCKHSHGSRAASVNAHQGTSSTPAFARATSAKVPNCTEASAKLRVSYHLVSKARIASAKTSKGIVVSAKLQASNRLVSKARAVSAKTSRVTAGLTKFRIQRLLMYQTDELLRCFLCKDNSFSLDSLNEKTEIFCKQCEREYHVGCLKEHGFCDLKELPQCSEWLCCADCILIHDTLQGLSNNMKHVIPVSLLNKTRTNMSWKDLAKDVGADMRWQILSGLNLTNKLLLDMAVALFQVMLAHFRPQPYDDFSITKLRLLGFKAFNLTLGRGQNPISAMVYAKDINGKSFGGMYCPIIAKKSVIVSAGLLRVFGRSIAELPLITTLPRFRRKGYFRTLLLVIEGLLSFLNVEYLIVSVPKDSQSLWTQKLGFAPVTDDRLQSYLKQYPLLMFENAVMLEKSICHIESGNMFS